MNEVQLFRFQEVEVQTLRDETGDTLFRAAHVCEAIGLTNPRRTCKRISEEFRDVRSTYSPGGTQQALFLREAGVWELLTTARLRKDNPNTERIKSFRHWLFSEVLPSIRKTGQYAPTAEPKLADLAAEFEATLTIARLCGLEGNQALLATTRRMKMDFGVDVQAKLQLALPSPQNELQRTPTQIAAIWAQRSGSKVSAQKVNGRLFDLAWQVKRPDDKGWVPTELGKEKGGLLIDVVKVHSKGKPVQQLVWIGDAAVNAAP